MVQIPEVMYVSIILSLHFKHQNMRLSLKERTEISLWAVKIFGSGTKVYLFGSRAIDAKRVGDIDLLIIPPDDSDRTGLFEKKIRFLSRVLDRIGEQKMDVIVKYPDDNRGIVKTAISEGIQIC